jgi:hypothetical protein
MRLASYVPGELIPLPLSGSIPELPHVAKVENRTSLKNLAKIDLWTSLLVNRLPPPHPPDAAHKTCFRERSLVAIRSRREDAIGCGHNGEQHEQRRSRQSAPQQGWRN